MRIKKFHHIANYSYADSPDLRSLCSSASPDGMCIYVRLPQSRVLHPYSSTSVVTEFGLCESATTLTDVVVTKSHLGDSLLVSVSDYLDSSLFPLTVTITNMSSVSRELAKGLLLAVVVDSTPK